MTREEAIAILEESKRQNEIMRDNPTTFWASHQMAEGIENAKRRIEALDVSLIALRPVSREQVEKVWPGCPKCKYEDGREPMRIYYPDGWDNGIGFEYGNAIFCPECGRPLTDEAVEMVMERLEELHDTSN